MSHEDILIVLNKHKVFVRDAEIIPALTDTEMKVLKYMMVNRGQIVKHSDLYCEVYGGEYNKETTNGILYNTI